VHYYGLRYYNPELGRWVSRDPIEERGGVNVYAFVWNRSVLAIDSLGRSVTTIGTADIDVSENSSVVGTADGKFVPVYPLNIDSIGPVQGDAACEYTFDVDEAGGGAIHFPGTEAEAKQVGAGLGQNVYTHEWVHANNWISTWNAYSVVANYYEGRFYCSKYCAKNARALVIAARAIKLHEWTIDQETWHGIIGTDVDSTMKAAAENALAEIRPLLDQVRENIRTKCKPLFCNK
jgi:uncharacterized protein RhaS with RHS repeats